MESRPKKRLDQVRDAIRVKHYARNTEQAYVYWIKKYILFHKKRHPKEMGTGEVQAFLTQLALEEHIAVRDAKGAHDRYTLLPASLVEPLQDHLIQVKKPMPRICPKDRVPFIYHSRWPRNTPTPIGNGSGNMFFLLTCAQPRAESRAQPVG